MTTRRRGRRAPGTGSVHQRLDSGRYQAGLVVGYNDQGNPVRVRKVFDSADEADLWLAEQRVAQARGELIIPENETLQERVDAWLASRERDVRPRTILEYRSTLERLVLPHLGNIKLADLKPLHVERLLDKLHRDGKSAYTQAKAHRYLGMVLNDAVRLELIHRNVARSVKPPKPEKRHHPRWSAEEAGRMAELCLATDHPVARYVLLGLATGLRREELLGLRWQDVDQAAKALHVRQVTTYFEGKATITPLPKTEAGIRTVHYDDVAALALAEQLEYVEVARAAPGPWTELDLVFPTGRGTPFSESWLLRKFLELIGEAGVPRIRLYDLRSTHGSILANAGVNPKLISERLGHANVAFTLQVYVRTQEAERREAGQVFGQAVQWQAVADGATTPPDSGQDEAADTLPQDEETPSSAAMAQNLN